MQVSISPVVVFFQPHAFLYTHRYMHSTDPQYDDPSSEHRLARVKSLPQPDSAADMLKILGDTGDSEYPIFRTATPPDTTATIATGQ